MSQVTRRIGLSLGADLCWPACYERILRRLDPRIELGGDTVDFDVQRVTIDPLDLHDSPRYDLVLDRVTHWFHLSREWIKKAVLMDDLYVLNNPWAIQSMEKSTTYAAMMRLGLPVPDTWLVPPKDYDWSHPDVKVTLQRYAKLFDLGAVGEKIGYPLFMKPYDGGAWVGVTKIDDESALRAAYDASGQRLMFLQKAVLPHDLFVRCVGVGPQVRVIKYDPSAPLHARYCAEPADATDDELALLRDMTLTINTFFGWDFNSAEFLRQDGVFHPIDFANACPDSQVTSLHYHFPWLVKAKLRWSIYVAATRRKMRKTLDWDPYNEIAATDAPFREKIAGYARIANERLDTDRFEEFCAEQLSDLDEVAWEFFGTDAAKEIVRNKVVALFPPHEIDEFTEMFWGAIQSWRDEEGR
jgi:hypothetical protein